MIRVIGYSNLIKSGLKHVMGYCFFSLLKNRTGNMVSEQRCPPRFMILISDCRSENRHLIPLLKTFLLSTYVDILVHILIQKSILVQNGCFSDQRCV